MPLLHCIWVPNMQTARRYCDENEVSQAASLLGIVLGLWKSSRDEVAARLERILCLGEGTYGVIYLYM